MAKKIQDGRRKIWFFANGVKTIAFRPHICIKHEYKVGYCGHFGVSTITLSGTVAEIRSFYSLDDNRVHVITSQTAAMNKKTHLARCLILFRKKHPLTFSFISRWKMNGFPQNFQGIFTRKQVFHQC